MKNLVLSIGGSIMLPGGKEKKYLDELIGILRKFTKEYRIFCVTGGGRTARHYIQLGRELGANESYLDEIGIAVTRLNASLLITAIGKDVNHIPARDYNDAVKLAKSHTFIVMGGVASGYTTDAVSAILAERVEAEKLIIMTSIDAVYSEDPRQNPKAVRYEKLAPKELLGITTKNTMVAGSTNVIDPVAALIISRSSIKTIVVHGEDLKSLENAIKGKKFKGTTIES